MSSNGRTLLTRIKEYLPGSFESSESYWKDRYADGGNSGHGSYGGYAEFKAEFLNRFIRENGINSIIEFGSGDGNQLLLAQYPQYLGVDISPDAVKICRTRFSDDKSKTFIVASEFDEQQADLVLSLDVVYHLIEDRVFDEYMQRCFSASRRFVIIYSGNHNSNPPWQKQHVRNRRFTDWVSARQPEWQLIQTCDREKSLIDKMLGRRFAGFYVYQRPQ